VGFSSSMPRLRRFVDRPNNRHGRGRFLLPSDAGGHASSARRRTQIGTGEYWPLSKPSAPGATSAAPPSLRAGNRGRRRPLPDFFERGVSLDRKGLGAPPPSTGRAQFVTIGRKRPETFAFLSGQGPKVIICTQTVC